MDTNGKLNKLIELVNTLNEEIALLKIEIRELKEQTKPIEKYKEKRNILNPPKSLHELYPNVQPGSTDDWYRKNILPKMIEEEKLLESQLKGKNKVEQEETSNEN